MAETLVKPECKPEDHEWWFHKAGSMEVGDGKIDMFEARCNKCGSGRAMDGRVLIKEMGLQPYVGKVLLSVLETAKKLVMPLFDSPTKPEEKKPEEGGTPPPVAG